MWGGVLSSLVRRRPRRRRNGAKVVDDSALGAGAGAAEASAAGDVVVVVVAARGGVVPGAGRLARAVLAMAWGAVVRLDGGVTSSGAEEAWAAASGWRPARAGDEVGHLMVRESLRYVIYA